MTGFPTVESSIAGMLMVGVLTVATDVAAFTVMVTGRMFLK